MEQLILMHCPLLKRLELFFTEGYKIHGGGSWIVKAETN